MTEKKTDLLALLQTASETVALSLWGHEFVQEDGQRILRVYVDKPGGVDLDDCARASRQMSRLLDVEEALEGRFNLEVSSPGIERPLFNVAQYTQFLGEMIAIKTQEPLDKRRRFKGVLRTVDETQVTMDIDGQSFTIPFAMIDKAHAVSTS
ncbi:MAG: ribosome maturation factor RimP [marine bacterium B5-7]|nr:MAG: ribosome maturation factor RimP [marine bacterium B5-7]